MEYEILTALIDESPLAVLVGFTIWRLSKIETLLKLALKLQENATLDNEQ